MNVTKSTEFLLESLSYEGGFAQNIGREAHGGSTFCAIAALYLMKTLQYVPETTLERIKLWLVVYSV